MRGGEWSESGKSIVCICLGGDTVSDMWCAGVAG